jgi:hypothetical protein
VDGVECDAHSGTLEYVCKGADFASYKCKFGPLFGFFWFVNAVVVICVPVGGGGVILVSTLDVLDNCFFLLLVLGGCEVGFISVF